MPSDAEAGMDASISVKACRVVHDLQCGVTIDLPVAGVETIMKANGDELYARWPLVAGDSMLDCASLELKLS